MTLVVYLYTKTMLLVEMSILLKSQEDPYLFLNGSTCNDGSWVFFLRVLNLFEIYIKLRQETVEVINGHSGSFCLNAV